MKKYYILTYGCQMNKSDSERIAAVLERKGYKPALKQSEADLIVVNMCSIRQSAVDRVFGVSQKLAKFKRQKPNVKTILTGCILKKDKQKFREKFDEIWGVEEIKSLLRPFIAIQVGEEDLSSSSATELSRNESEGEKEVRLFDFAAARVNKDYINIKSKCKNSSLAYVPISNGCNNFCAYCVVPFVRGPLICRDHKKILKEVENTVKNGFKEIWLLGQNVNDYNSPTKKSINLPKLLKMIDDIPGDFRLKFTSPNPKNFSDELINVMAESEKIAHYLNLPVQSGDNEILKKMNRPYTVQQYKTLVKKIRKKIPDIFLSTDVIVGFPGESKSQFENTVKLFKEINFDMAYISEFSPRPETAAAKMKDTVPHREKEKRWRILNQFIVKNIKERRNNEKKKLIVILGPTASGKSELAVKLAEKFNGEVVSADSRQVYKGMNIGTGKITKKEMRGIPHYLLDIASPKRRFSVAQYRKLATKAINKIFKNRASVNRSEVKKKENFKEGKFLRQGKIPILCGGTGFYIQAVVDGIIIPEVKPDWKLRKQLELIATEELFKKLKKLDPKRAKIIDRNNRRRLIRALEVVIKTKRPVPALKKNPLPYPVLIIGIKKEKEELKRLINKRLSKRLKQGMIEEVKKLRKSGVSWKRLEEFGLEYRFVAQYLRGKLKYNEMVNLIQKESEHFAKRQMTWFTRQNFAKQNLGGLKRERRIHWVKNQKETEKLVKEFLEKK